MAFPAQSPTPFTRAGVQRMQDKLCGCYGLIKGEQWVYIGKARDIKGALLKHLDGDNPCITQNAPSYFFFHLYWPSKLDELEAKLLAECKPLCPVKA